MTTLRRLLVAGGIVAALPTSLLCGHVAVFWNEMKDLRASMETLASEVRSNLSSHGAADVDKFLAGLPQTYRTQERIERMESRRRQIVSEATWLQKTLVKPVSDTWMEPLLADLETAYRKLPATFAQQTRRLAEEIENGARPDEARDLAVRYKRKREGLLAAAREAEEAGGRLLGAKIVIASSVSTDQRAQEIEDWIERSAAAEKAVLEDLKKAVDLAALAADQAGRVDLDAASREIEPVLGSWRGIAENARLAQSGLILGDPPKGLEPFVRGLLDPVERLTKEAVDEIDNSLARVDAVYGVALLEEADPMKRVLRAGRHLLQMAAGGPRGLGTASAQRFQQLSIEIATAIDECLSEAISSARTPAG